MASNIKIKRSAVQGKKPHTNDLELGELALNTFDGKLFAEINTGIATVVEIGSNLTDLNVSGVGTIQNLVLPNNVGIKTTTAPTDALRVEGNAVITGVTTISGIRYPANDGAANQVLRTNGFGVLSFGAASSAQIEHILPVVTRVPLSGGINQVVHVPISSGINTVDARSGSVSVTSSASVDTRTSTDPNGKTLTETFFNTYA